MNFLQICQHCIDIIDRHGDQLATTAINSDTNTIHRRVIIAVRKAYQSVQDRSSYWSFHLQPRFNVNGEQIFLTTQPLQMDYIPPQGAYSIRSIDPDSIYYSTSGEAARQRLTLLSYMDWNRYCSDVVAWGPPINLIILPSYNLRLWPTPDKAYNIYADWYMANRTLINDTDEPLWDSAEHDLLAWMAARDVMEFSDIPEVAGSVIETIRAKTEHFNRKYLPNTTF